ncbi:cyclic lactone autoinducer peptide [Clostridium gasigenes]|nr:cyclic lactone autoinducer peptide [Clostridium gasigenes]MBB6622295.1 cyclic lactone autoinducer peptide [Clostridium gasigenes]MBU3087075.1 cyclic lactone autoinducer peptide [Clostridium gasigenes]MBU3131107.1 cyclic lactone autoinducer peptide [Clostridium gasigenes]
MRKMNNKILMAVAAVATIVASTVATSACLWAYYQPEEPKCLREE